MIVVFPSILFCQTSQLVSAVSNFGSYGEPNDILPSCEFPTNSGTHYLFRGGFWAGAVIDGERQVTHADYGDDEWKPSGGGQMQYDVLGIEDYESVFEFDDYTEYPPTHHPMFLTVNQTVNAFAEGTGPDQAFLVRQVLINTGSYNLDSLYLGWIFDYDVASSLQAGSSGSDDWVSYQTERAMGYMWDGDNPSIPGDDTGDFGASPGYAGIALLDAPLPIAAFQWWDWNEDPSNDDEKFQYLAGIHPAAGGNAFRADPEFEFDYRVLISTGPYTLFPGESISTAMTFAAGNGLDGLNAAVDEMLEYYSSLSIEQPDNSKPNSFKLEEVYPNPFNAELTIPFELNRQSYIKISITNICGRELLTTADNSFAPGRHQVVWNSTNTASGVYFIKYQIDNNPLETKKIILLK